MHARIRLLVLVPACLLAVPLNGCQVAGFRTQERSSQMAAAPPQVGDRLESFSFSALSRRPLAWDEHKQSNPSIHDRAEHAKDDGHGHDEEVALGSAMIGDMKVEFAQGRGKVEAGKEGHLVVKLPYNDKGDTVVRGWIGMEDRTLSFVGKGAYAASHDDYDVHAIAPDPLPENVMWWIELAKPDGTKAVGSIKPLLE